MNRSMEESIEVEVKSFKVKAYWTPIKSKNLITPGGDPFVVCSNCGKGGHVYGIEHPTFIEVCPDCGAKMFKVKRKMKVDWDGIKEIERKLY